MPEIERNMLNLVFNEIFNKFKYVSIEMLNTKYELYPTFLKFNRKYIYNIVITYKNFKWL